MNRRALGWTLTGLLVIAAPFAAVARGRSQGHCPQPNCPQAATGSQPQVRQRLRDGSCGTPNCPNPAAGAKNRRGNAYGPGDGTGDAGAGPRDGTGFGAPSQP